MAGRRGILCAAVILALASGAPALAQSDAVNVYTYREPGLIQPLLDRFTEETGIRTNVLFAADGLIERVAAEGELSPADVIVTVDIGNLANAKELGITQAIAGETLARVPDQYHDPDGQWVALSLRARVFYASVDRVTETALTYEDIAGPEWKGRLCTRSGLHAYNIGLIATRIAHWGVEQTRDWLTGVRDNLNHAPTGADRDQVKAIFDGSCDLAIGNTYYMGLMLTNDAEPEQKEWAASARIIYPDADGDGTQVNLSGAVVAKYAPNKANADKLVAFLLSDEAQHLYASGNYEFPVVESVEPSELVASWGVLTADTTPMVEIAAHRKEAAALVDETRFDEGPQD
ncbi:iron ABC transporter substrate-binding protein [Devosia sp. Root436]|jgi:iron(III) transport system substrate-binding protein|uniref:extracellular solute-binding protein n=1 Tax=Devosia sp. Root436 TaxID=1736537 RepID=UPI0006F1CF53|nr:extracellular solute-binding protein [Devosia sp. Root436]KQX34755.1 iron ABC transporter substrate-binding protein [Devosia sp. Root436]